MLFRSKESVLDLNLQIVDAVRDTIIKDVSWGDFGYRSQYNGVNYLSSNDDVLGMVYVSDINFSVTQLRLY